MSILLTGMILLGNIYNSIQITQFWRNIVFNLLLNIILFYFLFRYNFFVSLKNWSPLKRYIWSILGTLIITYIFIIFSTSMRQWFDINEPRNIHIIKEVLMAISVLLINGLLYSLTRRQQIALENERLNNEKLQIQYDALASKLDPHFLFNSLNTLCGLIPENKHAQKYIEQLSDTYRYIIRDTKFVTLEEEITFTKSYLFLMQIRYNYALNVTWHIDETYYPLFTLPISIQLLVENAIKHNVVSNHHPLNITITSTPNNNILVENEILPRLDKPSGTGLGLTNLNKRFALLTDSPINIQHSQQIFSVEIPLFTNEQISEIIEQLKQ